MKGKKGEKKAKELRFTDVEMKSIYQVVKEYEENAPDEEEEYDDYYDEYRKGINKKTISAILDKISRLLPEEQTIRINKDFLQRKYHTFNNNINEKTYATLKKAFSKLKRVQIEYFNIEHADFIKRPVDIYYLSRRYAIGYCHLRKDMRKFRTSRIASAKIVNNSYTIPKTFNEKEY